MAKQKVAQVKESIERYKQVPHSHPGAPPPTHAQADCPPPYSTTFTQPYYPPTYQNTVAFVHGWPPRYVQFFYVLTPVNPRCVLTNKWKKGSKHASVCKFLPTV